MTDFQPDIKRPTPVPLPDDCINLLGKLSDKQVARLFGIPIHDISSRRQLHRIPVSPPRKRVVEWTDAMLRRIGEASDKQIACELGLPCEVVAYKRRSMNVPAYANRGHSRIRWTQAMLAQLGRAPDTVLAKQFGISSLTVQLKRVSLDLTTKNGARRPFPWSTQALSDVIELHPLEFTKKYNVGRDVPDRKRRKLGLPPPKKKTDSRHVEFTARMRALLGKRPDGLLARNFGLKKTRVLVERKRLGIPAWSGHRKSWTPEIISMLGRVPDAEISKRTGISDSTVQAKRSSLGIPALNPKPTRAKWTAAKLALLGTASDAKIARELGFSEKAVSHQRNTRGVKAYSR